MKADDLRLYLQLSNAKVAIEEALAALDRQKAGGGAATRAEIALAIEACFFAANSEEAKKIWD